MNGQDLTSETSDIAVYIHFPYCKSRCPYCDFFRGILPKFFDEDILINRYLDDLAYNAKLCGNRRVKSVFFGGGTPSLLSASGVGRVIDALAGYFVISDDVEISLEANPNTFEQKKFVDFNKAGINRLSLGVQALNEADLRFLGRTHSLIDALTALDLAVKVFPRCSVDLIYTRPNQRFDDWQKEIDMALSFGLKHISLYQLTLEEGTVFAKKNIELPDEEMALKFYEQTFFYLQEKGLERYEISNFASKGEESRHNLVYWQGGDYIGLGEGAHGRIRTLDGKILATVDGEIESVLSSQERAEELVIMGLRVKDGINAKAFYDACGIKLFDFLSENVTKKLAKLDLLCYDADEIKLTDKGVPVLDEIVRELLL